MQNRQMKWIELKRKFRKENTAKRGYTNGEKDYILTVDYKNVPHIAYDSMVLKSS